MKHRFNAHKGFLRIMITVIVTALCVTIGATAANAVRLPGDMDRDGQITSADARIVLRIAVKLEDVRDYMDESEIAELPSTETPSTKAEILNFYKSAAAGIKNSAKAGYHKKEWQEIGTMNITGLSTVDDAVKNTVAGYVTTKEDAEVMISEKGSEEAKSRFPGFTLTDYSKVASATLTPVGGNYKITIVMQDEDTPKKSGNFLSQVTNSVIYWEDVEEALKDNEMLKEYGDVHIIYRHFTIEAELTPDGRFVSLNHTAHVDITIGSAKIGFVTIKNKSASMDNYAVYSDFTY